MTEEGISTPQATAGRHGLPRRVKRLAAILAAASATAGCGLETAPILDPKGPIAMAERDLLFTAFGLMMIVVIPVFIMAFLFVWRYRAARRDPGYAPDWAYSAKIDAVVWIVPALIVIAVGTLVWTNTHKLDPYKPLAAAQPPLEVQAVAQDWKWLFIYPEQRIAVVNQLVFPSGTPLSLRITSDTVMNSLYIPALGGQIYAMAGMQSRLNLMADEPGRFLGRNMQYSGDGFADQHFEAIATDKAGFDAWVAKVRQAPGALDDDAYRELAKPSDKHPVTYYSSVRPNLFDTILGKYCQSACRPAAK
jgi:cytochrome o ubiquinol oxidase subunit 2